MLLGPDPKLLTQLKEGVWEKGQLCPGWPQGPKLRWQVQGSRARLKLTKTSLAV